MKRRDLLKFCASSTGILALSGCVGSPDSGESQSPSPSSTTTPSPSTPSPTSTPTPTPTPSNPELSLGAGEASTATSCGELTPLDPTWVVQGRGPLRGFQLTASKSEVRRGEPIQIELVNVSSEALSTPSSGHMDIQYRASEGWHSIFGTDGEPGWPISESRHEPGTAFVWNLEFVQDGFSANSDIFSKYSVCGSLKPGKYRFVYFGSPDVLGVPFLLTGDG